MTVRVKAIIDENGAVVDVRDIDPAGDAHHDILFKACQDAVMRWRFSPMIVVTETDDGKGNISQARQAKAFSQDYGFTFSMSRGRPLVTAESPLE